MAKLLRWLVAKLVARPLATAYSARNISKIIKWRHRQRSGQHTIDRQKDRQNLFFCNEQVCGRILFDFDAFSWLHNFYYADPPLTPPQGGPKLDIRPRQNFIHTIGEFIERSGEVEALINLPYRLLSMNCI